MSDLHHELKPRGKHAFATTDIHTLQTRHIRAFLRSFSASQIFRTWRIGISHLRQLLIAGQENRSYPRNEKEQIVLTHYRCNKNNSRIEKLFQYAHPLYHKDFSNNKQNRQILTSIDRPYYIYPDGYSQHLQ